MLPRTLNGLPLIRLKLMGLGWASFAASDACRPPTSNQHCLLLALSQVNWCCFSGPDA